MRKRGLLAAASMAIFQHLGIVPSGCPSTPLMRKLETTLLDACEGACVLTNLKTREAVVLVCAGSGWR